MHRAFKVLALALGVACGFGCQPSNSSHGQGSQASRAAPMEPSGTSEADESTENESAVTLPDAPPADPRERFIAAGVAQMLQAEHLAGHTLDDSVSERAFEFYVERLDPAKLLLLEPHVAALRKHARELDDQLLDGHLELARRANALLAERREKVAAMVARLTSQPFDLEEEEYFERDVDKRDFAATDAELEAQWHKNLKHQVLERMAEMREAATDAESAKGDADEGAEAKKGADAKDGEKAAQADKAAQAEDGAEEDEPPRTDAEREAKAREELAATYAGRFTRMQKQPPLEAVETFVNAFTAAFDPHTLYLAPDDKANFDIQMTGSLEGIGAVLGEGDHYIEVHEVVPGGAAWRQGDLEAGDLILEVAQEGEEPVDVGDMRINEVVRMIRGPKGTVVTLSVRKPDGRLMSIVITRDVVVVEATYARGAVLDLGKKHAPVGYIYLPGFYGNTRRSPGAAEARNAADDVRAVLTQFKKRKLDAAILDLRGNGGGLLGHATEITGLFIDEGPVVRVKSPRLGGEVLADEDEGVVFDGELVVLVDRFSASASEILAGALQDYGRALVVGTGPTHGKGTVQMIVDFDRLMSNRGPSLGVLKLTIQQFFLVGGESTQLRGVVPDVALPDPAAFVESGERYLKNPLPFSRVEPMPHEHWEHSWDVETLAAHSQARLQKNETFAKVLARAEYLKARRDETRVPLQKSAWRKRNEAEEKALEALDPKLDERPAQFSVELVRYRPEPAQDNGKRDARKAAQKRIDEWREKLARDPWVAESLRMMDEMRAN